MTARTATVGSPSVVSRGRLFAYFELTKPRVVAMVLVTTLAGYYLAAAGGGIGRYVKKSSYCLKCQPVPDLQDDGLPLGRRQFGQLPHGLRLDRNFGRKAPGEQS